MDIHTVYALIGFLLASYSVIGNDSVQTLGTFMSSNNRIFKWYVLWAAACVVLVATLGWSWYAYDGDISYGRLDKIPYVEVQWYHAIAPLVLVGLTRVGLPVSTTFLVLSTFASTAVIESMLFKSAVGYALAAVFSYMLWIGLSRILNEKKSKVKTEHRKIWRTLQWVSTAFLWHTWLSHDMANIAVYLPRQLDFGYFLLAVGVPCAWLGYIFYNKGGKIQKIILEKTGTRFMRSATIIDFVYAFILLFFKEYNNVPMSTTWVFVGVLCGRELAICTVHRETYKFKYVFPIVGKDFLKILFGLAISVALVLLIHYVLK